MAHLPLISLSHQRSNRILETDWEQSQVGSNRRLSAPSTPLKCAMLTNRPSLSPIQCLQGRCQFSFSNGHLYSQHVYSCIRCDLAKFSIEILYPSKTTLRRVRQLLTQSISWRALLKFRPATFTDNSKRDYTCYPSGMLYCFFATFQHFIIYSKTWKRLIFAVYVVSQRCLRTTVSLESHRAWTFSFPCKQRNEHAQHVSNHLMLLSHLVTGFALIVYKPLLPYENRADHESRMEMRWNAASDIFSEDICTESALLKFRTVMFGQVVQLAIELVIVVPAEPAYRT